MKIAVFTVCMPEQTPEEAAANLAKWGFDGVEWRVTSPAAPGAPVLNYWSGNRCTVDPQTILEKAASLKALCRKHHLAMPVFGTYMGADQLDLIEKVMQAAQVTGTKAMRVGTSGYKGQAHYDKIMGGLLKSWEKVVKLGRKYGIKPIAEMHMGTVIPSASAARRFADHFGPEEMGVLHDAGNMVYEGYENIRMSLEILGPYLSHVHVKNSSCQIKSAEADGNMLWEFQADTLRRGRVNWREVIDALVAVKYRGWLSLEDFSQGATEAKLCDDIAYLRRLIADSKAPVAK